jgi:hypothetical protein
MGLLIGNFGRCFTVLMMIWYAPQIERGEREREVELERAKERERERGRQEGQERGRAREE